MKVMFICTGNTCRSPMAQGLLEKMAKDREKQIEVYSCGTHAINGNTASSHAIEVMEKRGIDLTKHRATNIKDANIYNMDYIFCVTQNHKDYVLQLYPELKGKVYTIKEYLKNVDKNQDIKDPWGYDVHTYEEVAQELENCIESMIDKWGKE